MTRSFNTIFISSLGLLKPSRLNLANPNCRLPLHDLPSSDIPRRDISFQRVEAIMITKVPKWGNSQGLRFPKSLLEDAQVKIRDPVKVSVQDQKIIIEPITRIRGKYILRELVARLPKNSRGKEVNWGSPVGKEVW